MDCRLPLRMRARAPLFHVKPTNFPVLLAFGRRVFFRVSPASLHPPNHDDAFDMSALPLRVMLPIAITARLPHILCTRCS